MTYNDYAESNKKVFKNFYNGILPGLVLWIISKEDIHGYGIMKKLNELFQFYKSVKFYSITDDGRDFLNIIQSQIGIVLKNPVWLSFFTEMTGLSQ